MVLIMKKFQKSKYIAGSAVVLALGACGGGSSSSGGDENTAPTAEVLNQLYIAGEKAGPATLSLLDGAVDADGDFLYVEGLTETQREVIVLSEPEEGEEDGFVAEVVERVPVAAEDAELAVFTDGVRVTVRPSDLVDELDSNEVLAVTYNYVVTDQEDSISRTLTVNIVGEDFAPVIDGDVSANFVKASPVGQVDLLQRVVDADGEDLTVDNLVADAGNPFALSTTIDDDGVLSIDIDAIAGDIPDGEQLFFNFTYDVSDHRFTLQRELRVGIAGFNDVPGAPVIGNYFPSSSVEETDGVQIFDLLDGITDREGDDIVFENLEVDGVAELPVGVELDNNMLSLDPHAYFYEIAPGETKTMEITYDVLDTNDNKSDGQVLISVSIAGVETEFLAMSGIDGGFEDMGDLAGLPVNSGFVPGALDFGCASTVVTDTLARSGAQSIELTGNAPGAGRCQHDARLMDVYEADKKYLFSFWYNRPAAAAGPTDVPFTGFRFGADGAGNQWNPVRPDPSLTGWTNISVTTSTFAGGEFEGQVNEIIVVGPGHYDATNPIYYDDLTLVQYGDFDTVAHDIIANDIGAFDGDILDIIYDAGVVEIRDVGGENKLFVDTSGEASVSVQLPIKEGNIRPNQRYVLALDTEIVNGAGVSSVFFNLTNGVERIDGAGGAEATSAGVTSTDIVFNEEYGKTADVDWSAEDMMLTLFFAPAEATQYHIDNVRLILVP